MTAKRAIWAIAGFLALFVGMAGHAAWTMSATYDEPLHLAGGYVMRHWGDFRVNPEDPAGFGWLYSTVLPEGCLQVDQARPEWAGMLERLPRHWDWVSAALWPRDGSVDFEGVMWRARCLSILIGVGVVLGSGVLAFLLTGGCGPRESDQQVWGARGIRLWAGVLAVGLCCLDPTLAGHSAIVKNDVLLGLMFVVAAVAVVLLGREVTARRVGLLALALVGGVVVKFSGLLLVGLAGVALGVRAVWGGDWRVRGRVVRSRAGRVAVVAVMGCVCGAACYAGIWEVYGFRYGVSPDAGVVVPIEPELGLIRQFRVREREPGVVPDPVKVAAEGLPVSVKAVAWAYEKRVMPAAWCKGFLYTYATTSLRTGYLFSTLSEFGWRYYFPVAAGMKWPLGAVGLVGIAAWWGLMGWEGRTHQGGTEARRKTWRKTWRRGVWAREIGLVMVMVGGYVGMAMMGKMDIGVRHLIPVVPLVWGMVGSVVARGIGVRASDAEVSLRGRRWVVGVLVAAMGVETVCSYDRLIAFFNVPARAWGPERLLGDSNLDWGQDLKKLVDWQRGHPEVALSGVLFGPWPAEAYGLRYVPVGATRFSWGEVRGETPPGVMPGVVAISASWLQELFFLPNQRGVYQKFRDLRPREVIGGTIFLYNVPPTKEDEMVGPRWDLYWKTGDRVTRIEAK